MSQDYDPTKPQTGVTPFSQLYAILRNHFAAAVSQFSGTSFPLNPTPGQKCYRTDRLTLNGYPKCYTYTGNASFGESGWLEDVMATTLGEEILNSRGTKPSLDQRLDVALNEDGTLKASTTLNPSQWYLPSLTFTYVSSTSFTVNGDQTDIYKQTRRLKINLGASAVYSEVVSASYSSPNTTVQILDAVLNNTLVSIEHSLMLPDWDGKSAISTRMVGSRKVKTITANYTTTLNDEIILADASGGSFVITVLAAASLTGRRQRIIKIDTSANTVTIDPNGSETINGNPNYTISYPLTGIEFESDGVNLRTLNDAPDKVSASDVMFDGVASGLLGSDPGASLSMTIPNGVAYIQGKRVLKQVGASDLAHTYTANKDTYVDLSFAGVVSYNEVNNNNYVESGFGLSITAGTLEGNTYAGYYWINGTRYSFAGVSYTFPASKDIYDSIDSSGAITHTAVDNGAAQPSLPANSIWLTKWVTNATQITGYTFIRNTNAYLNAPTLSPNSIRLQKVIANGSEITNVADLRVMASLTMAKNLFMNGEVVNGGYGDTETIDLGTVTAGDRILVIADFTYALNSAGIHGIYITKDSGTAAISGTGYAQERYSPATSSVQTLSTACMIRVTGSGTLVIKRTHTLSAATSKAGSFTAFFLKKQ